LLDKLFILLKSAIETANFDDSKEFDEANWVNIEDALPANSNIGDGKEALYLTLVNVEEERVTKNQLNTRRDPNDPSKLIIANPEIKLNAYILASSNFKNYTKALRRLAYVLRVFQMKNVFSLTDVNDILGLGNDAPPILDQVIVDLYSQSLDQQYQFSQSYGNKQIPSVIYKVRLLVIDELPKTPPQMPVITTVGVSVQKM
jgi:hypothetical protein